MASLRILHIFRAPLGGLFRHVVDLARGQIARGHEVGIFCDSTTGGARADTVLDELRPQMALGVTRIAMRRLPSHRDVAAIVSLTALYRRTRPNILHGHGSKGGAFARMVTIPSLDRQAIRAYTPHGGSFNYNPGTFSHTLYMSVERLLARRTDVFMFESDYVKGRFDAFVGKTDRLVRVVRNGIDEHEFEPIQRIPEPFDLVYIGELRPAKGIDTLIDALAMIRRDHGRHLTLLVVGSGPSDQELQDRARSAGIWNAIAFVPPQPIRRAFSRAKVMVVPSKAESLPYVVLEAAAAAQPLVSTNVGGIPEIFGPYQDELISPGDPAALAARIIAVLDLPEDARREHAARLSRHIRSGFDLDDMVDGILEGYGEARALRSRAPT